MRGDGRDRSSSAGTAGPGRPRPGVGLVDTAPDIEATGPDLLAIALVHGERRNEKKTRSGDAGIGSHEVGTAIGGSLHRVSGVRRQQHIVGRIGIAQGVDCGIGTVTAEQRGPVQARRDTALGAVVLQTAEIGEPVRIHGAIVELRGDITVVAIHPGRAARHRRTADLGKGGVHRRAGIVGALDTTVAACKENAIAGAVVLRMEYQRVLVCMVILGIDTLVEPPEAGGAPVHTGIVRAPEVNAARPEDVGVHWIYSQHVVIPALVREAGRSEATFGE